MFGPMAALLRQRAGATAVEYALLGTVIAMVLVGVEGAIGTFLRDFFIQLSQLFQ